MKKYTLIIILLMLFFMSTDKVMASESVFSSAEYLNNISYVKHDGTYYHFRNAKAIKNVNTNNIAYCIEPFATLVDGSSYNGYVEYDEIFNLSKETWERIKLLSYYGYGYKNHYEEKWITITQILIWRTVDPYNSFNWINNVYDRDIIYPYEKEISEIESLILKHNILPSFDTNIKMSINSTIELIDNNFVLDNFKIKETDISAEIVNNKLIINSSDSGNKRIVLTNDDIELNKDVEFFYRSGTQSIIERGKISSIDMIINITVESGSIKIIKVDSDTKNTSPQGEASLIGAKYLVSNVNDEIVGEIIIGENCEGYLGSLPYGKFKIKEESSGDGYYLDKNEYVVEINKNNLDILITLENKVIKSKVKIIKYYGSKEEYNSSNMKLESGITFEFYDKNNNLVHSATTDNDGILEVELPYGNYIIKQVNTTFNYEKINDTSLVVDNDSNVCIELAFYDLEIDVPDAYIQDNNQFYDIILLLILSVSLGGVYNVGIN